LLGTAGRPSLGWEVRLGDHGEIQVRGAAPVPGYWENPEATSSRGHPTGSTEPATSASSTMPVT
jgi:hypothetical protein